jgi:hypothetical protein
LTSASHHLCLVISIAAVASPIQRQASMGWSIPRWKGARSALAQAGIIKCFHPGGRGPNDPPIYRWTLKGS